MFVPVEDYIQRPIEERQHHLDLGEACIEIGGRLSTEFRGLLAHCLKTTIPNNGKILLCHGCGNGKCSNPRHLYWGTHGENLRDAFEHGARKSAKEYYIEKHGEAAYAELSVRRGQALKGKNKEKKLSQEREAQIREVLSRPRDRGWVARASEELGVSHTQVRRYVKMVGA